MKLFQHQKLEELWRNGCYRYIATVNDTLFKFNLLFNLVYSLAIGARCYAY